MKVIVTEIITEPENNDVPQYSFEIERDKLIPLKHIIKKHYRVEKVFFMYRNTQKIKEDENMH